MFTMASKLELVSLPALLSLLLLAPTGNSAEPDPFSGKTIYRDVKHYTEMGHHQTATDIDHATSKWLENRLRQTGFLTQLQGWKIRQFFPEETYVEIKGGEKFEALPVWWPKTTGAGGLTTDLSDDLNSIQGKIYIFKNVTGPGFSVNRALMDQIDEAVEKGARAIIIATYYNREDTRASVEFIGLNAMQRTKNEWPVPVVMVKAEDFDELVSASTGETQVKLVSTGAYDESAEGLNVIGYLNRTKDKKVIVVSTPSSGWFNCAGERGTGIGIWLAMAEWAAKNTRDVNWLFLATSGHELRSLGTEHFLNSEEAPSPENTELWIHIGAWQAMYNYQLSNGKLVNTKKMDNKIIQFSGTALSEAVKKHFSAPALKVRIVPRIVFGDLTGVIQYDYENVAGISYGHEYHHSTQDLPEVTGPELLEPIARAYRGFLQDFIDRQHQQNR